MSAKLPGTYVNLLVDALRARNLSVEQLLGDFDIEMKDIEAPFWYVNQDVGSLKKCPSPNSNISNLSARISRGESLQKEDSFAKYDRA